MHLSQHYRKDVRTIPRSANLREAAELMAREGLGCLFVVDDESNAIGIVTDRDLVVRGIAGGEDLDRTEISEIMSHPLVVAAPSDALEDIVERMRQEGIRRIPLLGEGKIEGVVSLDDLVLTLSNNLHKLAKAARTQFSEARRAAKVNLFREDLDRQMNEVRIFMRGLEPEREEALRAELNSFYDRAESLLERMEELGIE